MLFEALLLELDNFQKSIRIENSNLRIQKLHFKKVVKQEAIGNFKQSLSFVVLVVVVTGINNSC